MKNRRDGQGQRPLAGNKFSVVLCSKRKKWEAEGERIRNYWQQKMEVLEVHSDEASETDSENPKDQGCRPTDPRWGPAAPPRKSKG